MTMSASDAGCIVLIGMPGAGKSTLGVVLAKMLNKGFVDCDLVIQQHFGQTLQRLIDQRGIEGFIAAEGDVLASIEARDSIIATGGSAVYSAGAMQHLAALGPVVYLRVSLESLETRLGDLGERGVVMRSGEHGGQAGLLGLYEERCPLYEQFADVVVDVDGLSISDAAAKVAAALGAY